MDAKAAPVLSRNDARTLALRLLELEQRFESYCTLHDEELKEIRSTLKHLRADMLALSRTLLTDNAGSWTSPETADPDAAARDPDGDGTGEGALDSLPILAL